MKLLIRIFVFGLLFTNLRADVHSGQWCYENYIQPHNNIRLQDYVERHSFDEWLNIRDNSFEKLKQELDYSSTKIDECISDIYSAILYSSSYNEQPDKAKALKCYVKRLKKSLKVSYRDFENQYTVLEVVDIFDNNASKLLLETKAKGNPIRFTKYLQRCIPLIMKSMVQDAKDTPKSSSIY